MAIKRVKSCWFKINQRTSFCTTMRTRWLRWAKYRLKWSLRAMGTSLGSRQVFSRARVRSMLSIFRSTSRTAVFRSVIVTTPKKWYKLIIIFCPQPLSICSQSLTNIKSKLDLWRQRNKSAKKLGNWWHFELHTKRRVEPWDALGRAQHKDLLVLSRSVTIFFCYRLTNYLNTKKWLISYFGVIFFAN